MKHHTPGKVILSGEHAIVHGRPAIALPLRVGVTGTFTPIDAPELRIHAPPFPPVTFPLARLPEHLRLVTQRHQAFLNDTLPVAEILPAETDLLLAAAALAEPPTGCLIHLDSALPPGSGLGSSAAVILTLLKGLLPRAAPETLHTLALRCEHFQHGRSSGLDVAACLHAAPVFGQNGTFSPFPLNNGLPAFSLYHTGNPLANTGECVARVRQTHPASHPIWDRFEHTTLALRQALLAADFPAFLDALRQNHRLLTRIGVVPDPVITAIAAIESHGGAAKICGAGSVRGDTVGTVLVARPLNNPAPLHIPPTWQPLDVL